MNWSKTGWIFLGWFLSPLISLLLTAILYSPIYFLVVKSSNPYSVISKIFYSFVIGLTFSINCATVLTTGDYFYRVLGVSSSWTGGRGLFYLVSNIIRALSLISMYPGVAVAWRHDRCDGLPSGHSLHHQNQRGLCSPLRLLLPVQC